MNWLQTQVKTIVHVVKLKNFQNLQLIMLSEWMETIGRKIVTDSNANVILMDYSAISDCGYVYLAKKVFHDLGEYLAKSILRWQLQLSNTRIIGHSLGKKK